MAQATPRVLRTTDTVIRDVDGEEILVISNQQVTLKEPNGDVVHQSIYTNIALVDGTCFHPAQLAAQPPCELVVCPFCRHPPYTFPWRHRATHGLLRLANSRVCECGTRACAKHSRVSRDGAIQCIRCARKWWWLNWIIRLFYSEE